MIILSTKPNFRMLINLYISIEKTVKSLHVRKAIGPDNLSNQLLKGKENKQDKCNYRPISLLSNVGKLLE